MELDERVNKRTLKKVPHVASVPATMANAQAPTSAKASDSQLLDLIRYDSPHHPFVDRYAHLSLSFSGPATIGPQALHPRSVLSTYEVVQPVLKLWAVTASGEWKSARRSVLRSWPWSAEEEGEVDGLNITSKSVFSDEHSVLVQITAENQQSVPVHTFLVWTGAGIPDRKLYMLDYFDGASREGRTLSVTTDDDGAAVVIELRPEHTCSLPAVSVQIKCESGNALATCSSRPACCNEDDPENGPFFSFRSMRLSLEPGQTAQFTFRISVACGTSNVTRSRISEGDVSTLIEQRRAALAPVIASTPKTDWLVRRARLGLLRCGLRGMNGKFGAHVASLCTADSSDFSCSFFWDSLFSSTALATIDPELARGAIHTAFTDQLERDGSSPERKFNHSVGQRMAQQSPQSPIATWAVNRYLSHHADHVFAGELYPKIRTNHHFWTRYSDTDRDGLAKYRWTGQVSDNSPLWDFYGLTDGKPAGCQWVPPVASVALNSFLYRDAIELARLATRLGMPADAEAWTQEAGRIAESLMEICFIEKERRFWDFNHHTQTHRRVRTFWMFLPLWAGVPVENSIKKELIEDVLLDERQFFGTVPFPSVAYNEPSYNPTGYWRGKSWPHVSTWLVELLQREGYITEARAAASRLMFAWASIGAPTENLSTDPLHPHGGFSDYNWGCAAVILLDHFLSEGKL